MGKTEGQLQEELLYLKARHEALVAKVNDLYADRDRLRQEVDRLEKRADAVRDAALDQEVVLISIREDGCRYAADLADAGPRECPSKRKPEMWCAACRAAFVLEGGEWETKTWPKHWRPEPK